jgi:uncharacterized protein
MKIRDATREDFAQVLLLNEEFVRVLSPLTPQRLSFLHEQAAYHRVIEMEGSIAAFLLAIRQGSSYDSPNYTWFASRYPQFLYVDRVVVGSRHQGLGLGQRLYADLLGFARACGDSVVTLEFDIDPPNEQSQRFHEQLGFRQAGTQSYGPENKRVSLQVRNVGVNE